MSTTFERLEDVIQDDLFPDLDMDLRRGRHVGRDDGPVYDFLLDAQDHLEPFYRRYGADLEHRADGYFFLRPFNDRLGRRTLTAGEMLVGQTLALLYLDPTTLAHGRTVARELLLQRLAGLVGPEVLIKTLNPRRRRYDERVAAVTVRREVDKAARRLADLGFTDLVDEDRLRLRPALMRFAETVRAGADPRETLARLVALGDLELGGDQVAPEDERDALDDEEDEA